MENILTQNKSLADALKDEASYLLERQRHTRYGLIKKSGPVKRVLISGAAFIITVDQNDKLKVLPRHSVYIVNGVIKDVFPAKNKKIPESKFDLFYDASKRSGVVITPGFINAHAHPPMYLLRSSMTLDKGNVVDQVAKMAKLEAKMNDNDFFLGAVGDFTEEQKNGITTTLSHYGVFDPIERAAKLTRQNVINAISAVSNSHPNNSPALVEKILKKKKSYFSTPAIAIHYVHKAKPGQIKEIKELVKKYKVLLTMHAAETETWVQDCLQRYGKRTIETLVDLGLANSNTVLSHAVHVTDEEIKLIAKHKIGIVHLPTSNKIHRSGEFKYPLFAKYKADKLIGLGTDSVISKNTLDLLSEALQTRIMHQHAHRVLYEDLFKMMTTQGANILKLGKVGRIAPGYQADIAFWKLRDRGFMPYNEKKPISLVGNMITHGGRNIRDLMIKGEFIISNRLHNVINESKLMTELQEAHMRLRKRIDN
ncbi:amidohydrolase family protein [Candidatus Falkowbacteria bacterium]|nr:amidohydrolase family protein [Candidatus Falkowbacteria bacterium]